MLKKQCFYRLSGIYMQRNSYGRLIRLYLFGGHSYCTFANRKLTWLQGSFLICSKIIAKGHKNRVSNVFLAKEVSLQTDDCWKVCL